MKLLYYNTVVLFLRQYKIETRPNAGPGFWLMLLLPSALIISVAQHPIISTSTYKLSSIFSLGLILTSFTFMHQISQTRLKLLNIWLVTSCLIVAVLFRICLHRGWPFSVFSAFVATFFYHKLYIYFLQKLPKCFTLGEAAICTQSYTLLLYFTSVNVWQWVRKPASNVVQMSTLTIQLGLLAISTIIFLAYKLRITSSFKFYSLTAASFVLIVLLPLQFLMRINPLLWILNLIWDDLFANMVVVYWAFFSIIAIAAVNLRIKKAQKASTAVRKIFHLLTVAVFIPGLLYNCSFLYLATGVILGIFFMLEVLRVLNMPPLAEVLQNGLVVFCDEKDTGIIAFTPMYLLAGCSLPLWIHPSPCDVTNSAVFNLLPLLSGLLTIGIGDTAASVVGSKFGKFHWPGSRKTIEGTLACILSQLFVIFAFVYLDYVKLVTSVQYVKTVSAVIVTSIVEAKTDQVDNLVLPFVMYLFFIVV
ncbi:dolichol kinase [Tribolium castaneum]|uniref:dolichol kinase n=1 Tax=Tribolium castaneum TaxID=7070 RepID=A0A139WMS4_TRICA|nr:PREDICTED: dolichol kinase [Tribolium castaneum]KYB29183.1 Dolichol kinase-like Protein [Tribolium castaneum]|eukprot:XP_008201029.1 PREDICTED: dolichol kinase [Tribolium castaneum]